MSSIDDRIVNMQFNNGEFQKGVSETERSLSDLKTSLQLNGASAGLQGVQAAADSFNLQGMENSLRNISDHFSAFSVVGITILSDIATAALNAGTKMANALIGPLVDGGAKRALALQQAKFQFQGLGLDVQSTMDAALAAVKGTAFGLDDAATAAAQFGASGINATNGLTDVLRSVAGVAAQTGSSFSSIANIFESVAGNGRLMGQDLLMLSSRGVNAAAVLAKSMGISEEAVRTMVTNGKISFAQFSTAMNKAFGANAANANQTYTGALDNMHAALSRIGADVASPYFLDMRDILNALTPVLDNIHHALKPLLDEFGKIQDLSAVGVEKFFTAFDPSKLIAAGAPGLATAMGNIFKIITDIKGAIGTGFHSIFPAPTVEQVTKIADSFGAFTAKLIPGAKTLAEFQSTFKGFFALIDIGVQLIEAIVNQIFKLSGVAETGASGILSITAKIGDFITRIDTAIKSGDLFNKYFSTVEAYIKPALEAMSTFFGMVAAGVKTMSNLSSEGFKSFAEDIKARFSGLIDLGNFFTNFWQGIVAVSKAAWDFLQPIFAAIGGAISKALGEIKDAFKSVSFTDAAQVLNIGLFGGILLVIKHFFDNIKETLKGGATGLLGPFKNVVNGIEGALKSFTLNTDAKTLTQIAIAVAILAASAVALSLVNSGKLIIALGAIAGMMQTLLLAFSAFTKVEGVTGIAKMAALAVALEAIATAVLILSVAVVILGALPLPSLIKGVNGFIAILGSLVAAFALLAKSGPEILYAAGAISILAPAMVVMAGAVALLGALPWENLVRGLGAFIVILAAMVGAIKLLKAKETDTAIAVGAIIGIAFAMNLIAASIAILAALPLDKAMQGVGAFLVVLAAMVGTIKLLQTNAAETSVAVGAIIGIAFAMNLIATSIAILASLPADRLIGGILGLGAAMKILVVSMELMQEAVPGAAAMVIAAVAITILASALKVVGVMNWDEIGRTMVVLAGSLLILAGAMFLMGLPPVLLGSVGILAAAIALAILAPALVVLSGITWDAIGQGLGILGTALGILAVGGVLVIPGAFGLTLLGGAIILVGTGVFIAAVGLAALALAVTAFVAIGTAGLALFGAGVKIFIDLLPELGTAVGNAFVNMAVAIGSSATKLADAFVAILIAMLKAIDRVGPQIIKTATDLIVSLINALVILIPKLVDAGYAILVGVLKGIDKHINDVVLQAGSIIVHFLNALAAKLPDIINAGGGVVLSYLNGMGDYIRNNSQKFTDAGSKIFRAIVDGISQAISKGGADLRYAGGKIGDALVKGAQNALGINSPSKVFRDEIMGSVFEGLEAGNDKHISRAEDAGAKIGASLGQSAISSVKSSISGITDALSLNVDTTPIIRPVLDLTNIKDAAKQIPGIIKTPTLSMDASTNVATSVSLQEQVKNAQLVLDSSTGANANGSKQAPVVFNQYNTSPKALSTSEVYRQTQNQLSTLKGDLGVVNQSGSS